MEHLLSLPILIYFAYTVIAYMAADKKFAFTQNLILIGVLGSVYIGLTFVIPHDTGWYMPLIQLLISGLFFVFIIGALGTKVSGASILSITALILMSPAPFFLWVFLAGLLSVILATIISTRNSLGQIKYLVQEMSVNPQMDYSYLPDQQDSLKGATRTHFVPLYALVGVCIGILSYAGFYALT